MNPDSLVAIDTKRAAQSFRSEVDGFASEQTSLSGASRKCLNLVATTCETAKSL